MLLLNKQKRLAGMGMAFAILAASVSGNIVEPTPVYANALGDWINSIGDNTSSTNNTDDDGNEVDGRAYITYRCSNAKIKLSSDSSSTTPVNINTILKFTIKAEFSDTDASSKVYYQIVDNGSSYDNSAWKSAIPTVTGLITQKTYQFIVGKTIANKVVYIKSTCGDRTSIIKTVPFNLDLVKPTVKGVKNGVTYTKKVTVEFNDALSGVKTATLNGAAIKTGKTVKSNGSYKLIVTDKAGNKKTVKFKIDK